MHDFQTIARVLEPIGITALVILVTVLLHLGIKDAKAKKPKPEEPTGTKERLDEVKGQLAEVKAKLRAYNILEAKIIIQLSSGPKTHEDMIEHLGVEPIYYYRALGSLHEKGLVEPAGTPIPMVSLVRAVTDQKPVEPSPTDA